MAEQDPFQVPHFDADHLPDPEDAYVCWLDLMGTQKIMTRSLYITSNFIFKLHMAAKNADDSHDVQLYPAMDGVYVVSKRRGQMEVFLEEALSNLAKVVVDTEKPYHRFAVRACVSFGPIIQGRDVPDDAINEGDIEDDWRGYFNSLLLGVPIIQSYRAESDAPPFGVLIDESARSFAADGDYSFSNTWWQWYHPQREDVNYHELATELSESLDEYFEWCREHRYELEYDNDRIDAHKTMMGQYFP